MSKLPKFEIELPAAPKSTKLSLSERDIAMATMYVCPLGEFLLIIVFSAVMIGGCKHTRAALAPVASEHTRRTPLLHFGSYEYRKLLIFRTFFSDFIDFVILEKFFFTTLV